jgi:hypothetical protein
MKIKKIWFVLFIFVCASCSTTPTLRNFFVSPGVIQYFIPATEWKAQDSKAKAQPDITYRTGADTPAYINISFFGEKTIPRAVTSISFNGNDIVYPLENITILYPDLKKKELRVSTEGDRDTLLSLLEAESITLVAEIDGVKHTYIPKKNFYKLKNEFLILVSSF